MASVLTALRLELLGGFAAHAGARLVSLPTRKTEAVLAFLALSKGRPVRRDALARLLWGAQGPEHARNSLRQALTALRHALGAEADAVLRADRDTVTLDAAGVEADAHDLARLGASGDVGELCRAADLYRGEFLAGFEALPAPGFVEWRAREAARLRGLATSALLAALRHVDAAEAEPGGEAASVAQRLLELDPLQEAARRALARHHAARGQSSMALEQCGACSKLLLTSLGTASSPQTERVREELAAPAGPVALREEFPAGVRAVWTGALTTPPAGKPSVAVLPFENPTGDPEQDYFADGLVEDITTALARMGSLFVVSRNLAFTFRGQPIPVRRVGRELGVRYVLEGSVRRAGGRIRITAQLIDAATGGHVWAQHFDGDLADVFGLQDRITEAVIAALEPSLRLAEIGKALAKPTESLEAYDLYLRALAHYHALTEHGSGQALGLLKRAVEADPGYARAKALASMLHGARVFSWWDHGDAEVAEGCRLAREALLDGQNDPEALRAAGYAVAILGGELEAGVAALDRALLLGGETAPVLNSSGRVRNYAGDWATAVDHFGRAMHLSPLDPEMSYVFSGLSVSYFIGRRYDEAVEWARRSLALRPGWSHAHRCLVTSLANMGRTGAARAAVPALLAVLPRRYSIASHRTRMPYRDQDMVERFLGGLRMAGVPE